MGGPQVPCFVHQQVAGLGFGKVLVVLGGAHVEALQVGKAVEVGGELQNDGRRREVQIPKGGDNRPPLRKGSERLLRTGGGKDLRKSEMGVQNLRNKRF